MGIVLACACLALGPIYSKLILILWGMGPLSHNPDTSPYITTNQEVGVDTQKPLRGECNNAQQCTTMQVSSITNEAAVFGRRPPPLWSLRLAFVRNFGFMVSFVCCFGIRCEASDQSYQNKVLTLLTSHSTLCIVY